MALEGNLTDFGLSEILQLIAIQQKSGMLSITTSEKAMVLFFRNGKIVSARDRRRRSKDPFKDYLLQYGVLTRNDLIRIVQLSTQAKLDITEIMVSEGFLTEEVLKKHFRNQIQETLHEILTWQQCSYKFIPGNDIIAGLKTWGEYSIEGLLMESMRRIDELPGMLEEFPDTKMRISRMPDAEFEEPLDTNEQTIWNLLENERSLYDLISNAKMPRFDTYEALKHLQEKNLLVTRLDTPEQVPEPVQRVRSRKRAGKNVTRAMPVVVLLALFALSVTIGTKSIMANYSSGTHPAAGSHPDRSIERNRVEARIRLLLECYQALNGSYPDSLQKLESAGLVPAEFMRRAEGFSFRYHLTPLDNTYTLL